MKLSKHILVVEDEPDTAELLEFHLENAGYKVTIAEDGYQALKKIQKVMTPVSALFCSSKTVIAKILTGY
jgi:CheY-like chemotaxis protein|tara:strand:+ start:239 stop:448 length:210 start_codon:yes stop_codon:yes gene_type:complete